MASLIKANAADLRLVAEALKINLPTKMSKGNMVDAINASLQRDRKAAAASLALWSSSGGGEKKGEQEGD